MPGASQLAAMAAMQAGAGYVKLCASQHWPGTPPGLVVDTQALDIALDDHRIDALLIGPGLGLGDDARTALQLALEMELPMVVDGDALRLLDHAMLRSGDPENIIVTPHEGELAALCSTFAVVEETKREKAAALHAATGMTVIAKGPDTSVHGEGEADRETILTGLFRPASGWLSVAGTGDVLAGIVASRLATGQDPFDAACQGVWLHGEAARQCGPAFTADRLAASIGQAYGAFL